VLIAAAAAGGCAGKSGSTACSNAGKAAFVFVETPQSGDRVSSGFEVKGCSSTFEGNVIWSLRSRTGRTIVGGHTQGGSESAGPFEFTVTYTVAVQQVGQLEVDEPRVTSEGFPPTKNVLPVVLAP
jgi:immunoglobulin-like protein involved in spore germination